MKASRRTALVLAVLCLSVCMMAVNVDASSIDSGDYAYRHENMITYCYEVSDLVLGADGVYRTVDGEPVFIAVDNSGDGGIEYWLGGYTLLDYVDAYGEQLFDLSDFEMLLSHMDDNGYVPLTEDTLEYLITTITGNPGWGETEAYVVYYLFIGSNAPCYRCGENLTWNFSNGTLTISGRGDMSDGASALWEEFTEQITKVVVEEGVTSIGNNAFSDHVNLETVSLPDSLGSIGSSAFWNCTSLQSIRIPENVSNIAGSAFTGCGSLEKITVDKDNTSYCSVSGILYSKDKTVLVAVPGGVSGKFTVRSSVTTIGAYAFAYCEKITEVCIHDGVNRIEDYAFFWCSALEKVNIPEGIQTIPYACFYRCTALTNLEIADSVTDIREFGLAQTGLTSLTLPDGIEILRYAVLNGCVDLVELHIPDSVTVIEGSAISACYSLKELIIPQNVVQIDQWALSSNQELTTVWFEGDAPEIDTSAFRNDNLTICYLEDANGWKALKKGDFEGTITWQTYCAASPQVSSSNVAATGKIELTWEEVAGAVEYRIYRATSKNGTYTRMKTTTDTSYTNTSAKAGKAYYYKVEAVDNYGNVAVSQIISRTCDLARPTVTLSNVESSGKIKVSWDAVDGAVQYEVYRAASKNGTYIKVKTTTGTSYTNTSAEAGKTYYYKVKAIAEKSAANSAYSAVKSRTCDLARPTVTLSNVASTGKIKVSWDAVDGAVEYEVYRATSKNGTYTKVNTTTGTSYTNTSAEAGKTYYYKVRAVAEKSAANSAYSTVKSRTCDLARPSVSITLNSSGKPKLSWKAISGAVEYQVYRATSKNGEYKLVKTTTSTSFTNTGAKSGVTYYYKVIAVASKEAANSAYSKVVYKTAK